MDDLTSGDICRVCRCKGDSDLFHPCICTGSIKFIHQECLLQWMRYSRKEYCELCGHRFSFTPIYSPDMPRVLPLADVAGGLLNSVGTAVKYWLHYTLVALAWLGIVPLTAYRTYRFLFSGSLESLMSLPFEMFSMDNIAADVFRGCFVVTCTLFGFIGLVWLREQIVHGGGPDWLDEEEPPVQEPVNPNPAAAAAAAAVIEDDDELENNNNINNNNNNNEINGANWIGDRDAQEEAPIDRPIDPAEPAADANEQEGEPEPPGEEANWNPMEWDRAAEELTWERLLDRKSVV